MQLGKQYHGKLDPSDVVQQTLLEAIRGQNRYHGSSDREMAGRLTPLWASNGSLKTLAPVLTVWQPGKPPAAAASCGRLAQYRGEPHGWPSLRGFRLTGATTILAGQGVKSIPRGHLFRCPSWRLVIVND